MTLVQLPLAFAALALLAALTWPEERAAARRLRVFGLSILPLTLGMAAGPLAVDVHAASSATRETMLAVQYTAFALTGAVAAGGIYHARGARSCAVALAAIALLAAFVLMALSVVVIGAQS